MRRIPSFNDFSPGIIKDVRRPLEILDQLKPDMAAVVTEWDRAFFNSARNKRASTNVPATLSNLGLMKRQPLALTNAGKYILDSGSEVEAAQRLVRHIVDNHNGISVIDAIRSITLRGEAITKDSLKRELEVIGIEGLSNATTDHTTLLNWMIKAGLFIKGSGGNLEPDETVTKDVLGISASERSGFAELPLNQQIFVQVLRRLAEGSKGIELPAKQVIDECLRNHRG